jgi:hypothetical protein
MMADSDSHQVPEASEKLQGTTVNSERPPLFRSWNRLYGFVLGELVLLIVLFYAFSKLFQ